MFTSTGVTLNISFTNKEAIMMKKRIIVMFITCCVAFSITVFANNSPGTEDKTLSPYFHVISDDPELDQLPLKDTRADVNIAGVIADVTVTQTYKNEGKRPLEAIYVFPASTKASVYGMKMTIGERTIVAKVREREQARQEYEEAKQAGKSASLLEQQRPNVFQMNVANILPGDVITVELRYTELLTPTEGVYEFVYPTVVGPRYSEQPEETAPASEKWIQNPYLHEGESPPYTFDITVDISGSIPIQEIACSSHHIDTHFESPLLAKVHLGKDETFGGNKDFVLKYRLTGGNIESGLLLYEGGEENFFLLMVQPPERVKPENIPPREYIFIVDVSGSMHGFPLDISKTLLRHLIGNLRPTDMFNVLLFAGGSSILSEKSLPATSDNIKQAVRVIDNQSGGGGTQILPAMERALKLPTPENFSRTFIIVTDGYVSVEKETFDLIREMIGSANVFSFGIGSSVNRFLIEGMARVGMGEPFVITQPDEAASQAERFRTYIQTPVLTRATIDFGTFEVYDVEPPGIPDVFAERPVIVFGKWRDAPKGTIRLEGFSGTSRYTMDIDVRKAVPDDVNKALTYLWARHRIALLSDYNKLAPNDDRIEEVTRLGLKYNLLTQYTSFVAVDSLVRNKDGESTTIKQPLPLPEGVSDYAVGQGAPRKMLYRTSPSPTVLPMNQADGLALTEQEISKEEGKPADKKSPARVEHLAEKMKITGNLKKEDLTKLIEANIEAFLGCYENVLKRSPQLSGEIVLRFDIDDSGKIHKIELYSEGWAPKMLKKCIADNVKKWRPTENIGSGTIEYHLKFYR